MTIYSLTSRSPRGLEQTTAFDSALAQNLAAIALRGLGCTIVRETVDDQHEAEGCIYCGRLLRDLSVVPYCGDECRVLAETER